MRSGVGAALKERLAFLKNTPDRALEAVDAKKSGALPVELGPVAIDHFTHLLLDLNVKASIPRTKRSSDYSEPVL